MQLEGMLLLLSLLFIIPVLSIFSDDTTFLAIFSLVLCLSSLAKIISIFFPVVNYDDSETKELIEEIKNDIDLDFDKIKQGIKTVKALVIILYFIYSCFFLELFSLKIASSIIVVYWIRYIVEVLKTENKEGESSEETTASSLEQLVNVIINMLMITIIIFTVQYRFFS